MFRAPFHSLISFVLGMNMSLKICGCIDAGKMHLYRRVPPREAMQTRQHSYQTHVWTASNKTFRLLMNGQVAFRIPESETTVVHRLFIDLPEFLQWTPSTHHHFPAEFKRVVQTLLKCHQRLAVSSDDGLKTSLAKLPNDILDYIISLSGASAFRFRFSLRLRSTSIIILFLLRPQHHMFLNITQASSDDSVASYAFNFRCLFGSPLDDRSARSKNTCIANKIAEETARGG